MLFLEKIKIPIKIKKTKLQTRSLLKRAFTSVSAASLTVEAACVVPVFLFAILQILTIFDIYRLQTEVESALHQTAREMAVYAHASEQASAFSILYAQVKVNNTIGRERLGQMPIKGGSGGLSLLHSKIMENDCIDLVAVYEAEPLFSYFGFVRLRMANRCVVRGFTGYDNARTDNTTDVGEEIVYITESGQVYHRDYNCSALSVSVRCVSYSDVGKERNYDREKYYACPYCGKKASGSVYITIYGNRYHASILCHELKRCVLSVPLSQVEGRRACMKCGGVR